MTGTGTLLDIPLYELTFCIFLCQSHPQYGGGLHPATFLGSDVPSPYRYSIHLDGLQDHLLPHRKSLVVHHFLD